MHVTIVRNAKSKAHSRSSGFTSRFRSINFQPASMMFRHQNRRFYIMFVGICFREEDTFFAASRPKEAPRVWYWSGRAVEQLQLVEQLPDRRPSGAVSASSMIKYFGFPFAFSDFSLYIFHIFVLGITWSRRSINN